MTASDFIRPRLNGNRFSGKEIPLEFLKDLAVLEEMVIEVSKWQYLQDHPTRKRTPRGFADGFELKLTRIDEGSAIPVIGLALSSMMFPQISSQSTTYLEKARDAIIMAIDAADNNQSPNAFLPEKSLGYFDRIGRSLKDDEYIEFSSPSNSRSGRLNRDTRRRLLLASSSVVELTEDVTLRGSIPQADQSEMNFTIQQANGAKIPGPIPNQHLDTIVDAFKEYRIGTKVIIWGVAKYNRQNKITSLESVEHISFLDPLDVPERLDELRSLNDGWLNGVGIAPRKDGLDWLSSCFNTYYPYDIRLPYVYPTAEGGIQAEWSINNVESSLEIDLASHKAEWYSLNLVTKEESYEMIDLGVNAGWEWVVGEIRKMDGGEA
ncbi:MAG TPA: hypothetical protein VN631_15250 [Negativicutes bacterium]|nr:hypothetical protein [Negativicutes bacterium]